MDTLNTFYPCKGFMIPVNNYKSWEQFKLAGLYKPENDNRSLTRFGDELDIQAAINLKIILNALLETYKGDKVGSHYLADIIAPMVDHADDLIYVLQRYYDKED